MPIHPIQDQRMFTFDTLYSGIPWNHFPSVVNAFRSRLEYWYLLPTLKVRENHHYGFSVLANTCMLIDCLSQYEAGALQSHRDTFKNYLRQHWPDFDTDLVPAIQTGGHPLTDRADVVYGVRCGVLHENHIPMYAGIVAQDDPTKFHAAGYAKYSDGTDCPVVIIDPGRFFDMVHDRFEGYLAELVNPSVAFVPLRERFRNKFEYSSGVTISIAV